MPNPAGNYPGRQIFLGGLDANPAFAYLVTGRSKPSQQRYASPFIDQESAARIKPTNPDEPFDPFRHYQAVRIDKQTGLLVVSNSQAPNDAVVEMLKLATDGELYSRSSDFGSESPRLRKILAAIGPEYDNMQKRTPRIVGAFVPYREHRSAFGLLGITTKPDAAVAPAFELSNNTMSWVATYNGPVEYESFDESRLCAGQTIFHPESRTADALAHELFGMTDYIDAKYGDLRVCCIAGILNGRGPGGWELARVNRHKVE